jgi:hypothetical protein
VWLLNDNEVLDSGLRKMAADQEYSLEPKRNRYETLTGLVHQIDQKMERLLSELGEGGYDDELLVGAFRRELNNAAREKKLLQAEKERISQELKEAEMSPAIQDQVKELVEKYRKRLPNASFEDKRFILDVLDVKVVFQFDGKKRWLEVSCGLPGSEEVIALPSS